MTDLFTGSLPITQKGTPQEDRAHAEGSGVDELWGSPIFWEMAQEGGLPGTLLRGHGYTYIDGVVAGTKALRSTAVQLRVQPMETTRAQLEAAERAAAKTKIREVAKAAKSTGAGGDAQKGTGDEGDAPESTGGGANAPHNTPDGTGEDAGQIKVTEVEGEAPKRTRLSEEKVRDLLSEWEDDGGSVES